MAWRRAVTGLLILSGLFSLGYIGISSYIAEQLVYTAPRPIVRTPASLGLRFANVTFPSRDDHISLKGWLIPGMLPDGRLTVDRAIVAVHGTRTNRESPGDHLLELTGALARHGFAVLSFDMRGMGESPPAPLSMGNLEQRDVLGAVDFLRRGTTPFAKLGRPRIIGGLGISMGASTLLLAAAAEPNIKAVVSDSAYADVVPLLEREIAKQTIAPIGRVPGVFAPSALLMARLLYGVDFFAARPVATVARIAPRPLFLIHGTADDYVPITNFRELNAAATSNPTAQVTTWIVPNARHAQAFKNTGAEYVTRVVTFFDAALGADPGSAEA
jgi:dipeptidyl aminopeptidase/acylaminoacyl peptidase